MIPSNQQIDREIAFFGPGLGRMQAINRIRQREAILRDRRVATFAALSADFDRKADALAEDLRDYRARCDAALARTQEPSPC